MDSAPIFSAEQIRVAEDLPAILKEYTKAVIRANPEDVVQFSAEYVCNGSSAGCGCSRPSRASRGLYGSHEYRMLSFVVARLSTAADRHAFVEVRGCPIARRGASSVRVLRVPNN